jgi:energy-coupling factor transporter ATP-binding protein EcfA2
MLRKRQTKVQEVDVEQEILAKSKQILHQLFKDKHKQIKSKQDEIQNVTEMKLDKIMYEYETDNQTSLSTYMKDNTRRFYNMFDVCKRIALVGPICSGKSTLLKVLSYALNKMKKRVLNYSVISPKSFTYGQLYGCSDNAQAYSSDIQSRSSIYSVILDKYAQMDPSEAKKIFKSIVIDSEIDEVDSECTIQTSLRLQKTEELDNDMNKSYIKFPNGITLELPYDLYFFYETNSLRNASPRFIASVGVIMTNEKFISWREIIKSNVNQLMEQNTSFFKMFNITKKVLLHDIEKIVVTIVNKFESQFDQLPLMWDKRMHIMNFFKVFKAYLSELKSVILRNVKKSPELAKETIDTYNKTIMQNLNNFVLISLIWSFSGILDIKNRRKFENIAGTVDTGYKLNLVTSNKSESLSFFDLTFDFDRMHWVTLIDLEEYGVPMKIDSENLVIMTDDYLKYYNFVSFMLKNSYNSDFGCVILGDNSTFKSTILKAISYKYASRKLWLPMSCYMTLPKLKSEITNFAGGVNRKHDDAIILIDDLHLQSNIKVDILDYLRMWSKNRGHYNVEEKSFDSLCNLKTIMTFDLKYGIQSMKTMKNIDITQNRYTYYSHSIYIPQINKTKIKRILQGIAAYRLDAMFDHPLNGLHIPLIQSVM